MSRAHLLGGPRTLPAPPPPEPTALVQIDISASFFPASTPAGTMIATLSPPPQVGETRAFNPPTTSSDAVYFGVDGAIYRGSGTPFAGDYVIRQTLAGADNSPLDTSWTVTTYTPANLATVGVTPEWNGTSNMGGVQPTPTVFDTANPNAVKQRFVQLAHSDHETMTGDLILGFVGEGPITVWFGGNSVEITDISVQTVRDPRDGVMRPQLGYFCKALKPAADTGKIVYYATSPGDGENETTTIGPFECYPRASAYDTLLKIAYTAHVDATPTIDTGIAALGDAFQYKAEHPDETVWIEILDDPPIGWKFGQATPNYDNATTYTKIFGTEGHVAKIGDFSMPFLQPGIDGIEWGQNTEWQLAAMGPNGSQPMRLNAPGRFRLWGVRFSCENPGAHSGDWSGTGSNALYKRRQPSGFAVYPNGDPTLIMHAGFCNIEDVPAFGLPCAHLALYNDGSDVSGSFFENQFGAVLHNTLHRIGGRQSGLRGYNRAVGITVNRTTYPYFAVEKTPANGNVVLGSPGEPLKLSVPVTIETAGSGYTDGIFDASSQPGHSPRLTVSGGSGTGMLVDATIVGGSLSKVYISKSTLMGAGYKAGDVLTVIQGGGTGTTPATIKLGSTYRVYGGATEPTAPVIAEMLLYEGMSHTEIVDLMNDIGPGVSAVSLNPAHDLDVTFLVYDAQPAAGVPTASVIASNIPKRTWTGPYFELSLGVDIHSNMFVNSYLRFNIITQYNSGLNFAESAPISMGRGSKPHWLFTHNELYDSTSAEFPTLSAQQGYWQGQTVRFVFHNNTIVSSNSTPGKGGGTYFGTLFNGNPAGLPTGFSIRNNLMDGMAWTVAKQQLDFYNNVFRNMTQAQVDALAWDAALDGDSEGLTSTPLSNVIENGPGGDFTAKAMLQRNDGSWAGARDNLGNYAGLPPLV